MSYFDPTRIFEASSLGWKPGVWPDYTEFEGRWFERYNPLTDAINEIVYYDYRSIRNHADVVRVIND